VRKSSSASSVLVGSLAVVAVAFGACDQGSSAPLHGEGAASGAAVGGNSALGGASPTGGRTASGGAPGFGGAGVAGGSSGSGGTEATGGTVSTGGTSSAGGTEDVGGGMGVGGATGEGGRTRDGGAIGAGGTAGNGGSAGGADAARDATLGSADTTQADVLPKDAAASDSADAPPQTCPAGVTPPAAGNSKASLQHGGSSRSYILHVPSGLTSGKPLAVVFDLHGAGGSGSQQQGMSGWGAVADREKFLVVYPDGIDGYWNVDDKCCGTAGKNQIDDVGFLRAIIDKLSAATCIDTKRIYVSGFSNGGGLTHRMGCDAADVIAAIAPVSTDLRTQPCNAVRPISMMEVRGMADSLEPYEGGKVGPEGGGYLAVGAKASLGLWADINQCTGTPKTIETYCEGYTECRDGVETDLCSLPNVDHGAYNNSLNFNIASTAWKMFQRQPMR
jgi:poly(3-hydroxybutyrate) depolymerase